MEEFSNNGGLLKELARERSIRRILRVLEAKRSRINDDLNQLVTHLGLLFPPHQRDRAAPRQSRDRKMLLEALDRLERDGFTDLLQQIVQDSEAQP